MAQELNTVWASSADGSFFDAWRRLAAYVGVWEGRTYMYVCVCVCVCGGGGGGGECGCGEMYDVCVCMRKSSVPCVLQLKCNTILS